MDTGNGRGLWWLGAGALGVTVLALAGTDAGKSVADKVTESMEVSMEWIRKVVGRVSAHEGGYDAVNLNTDGAGLSFGLLQWAQRSGTLGMLLNEMAKADAARFAQTFGPDWRTMLQTARAASLKPVSGALLWQEPWVSRFRAAGRDPVFIAVQDRLATQGDHMQAALAAARSLGLMTERSLALMYDTAVQQGPGFARKVAEKIRKRFAGQSVDMKALLTAYAQQAPAHFRRTSTPTEPYPVAHIAWKQVGTSEWHAFASSVDLYSDVLRRRLGIVSDPALSDQAIGAV